MDLTITISYYVAIQFKEESDSEMSYKKPSFVSEPKNSSNAQTAISRVDALFQRLGLDNEIIDHLWSIPCSSLYGSEGKPYIAKTIKDQQASMLKENDLYQSGINTEGMELLAKKMGITLNKLIELDRALITQLFKGLDKNLSMPVVVRDLETNHSSHTTLTTAHSMACLNDDDHVAFSPKNIAKHYKWKEADAKVFFKNIKESTLFTTATKIRLVKPNSKAYYRNVFVSNHSNPNRYMWSFSQNIEERMMVQFDMSSDYSKALELTDRPLPTLSLNSWKDMASRRFERLNPGSKWDELSVADQKRRLVNLIRHNSVSYVDSWSNAEPEHVQHLHDISFERTLKKIMVAYPYLAEECKRQLNTRSIPLNPKLSS